MTLKVFTAFSDYDSQCMALDRMKIITSISNNIKGISKKAGGYIWKKI